MPAASAASSESPWAIRAAYGIPTVETRRLYQAIAFRRPALLQVETEDTGLSLANRCIRVHDLPQHPSVLIVLSNHSDLDP
jgi:hypothetical protein